MLGKAADDLARECRAVQRERTLPIPSRFAGVDVRDATTISLTDDLCDLFPGCGNQHHREAAAIKAVVRPEVLSGKLSAADLSRTVLHPPDCRDLLTRTLQHLKRLRKKAARKTNPGTREILNPPDLPPAC